MLARHDAVQNALYRPNLEESKAGVADVRIQQVLSRRNLPAQDDEQQSSFRKHTACKDEDESVTARQYRSNQRKRKRVAPAP